MQIRACGAQLEVTADIDVNVKAIEKAICFAADQGADILITPEGSLSGYTHLFDSEKTSQALQYITEYACKASVGLALGTCFKEPSDDKLYNQLRFYSQGGEYLGFHSKILRCSDTDDPDKNEVALFQESPLRTFQFKGITIGGLLCNDLWANPCCTVMPDVHLSQQLSQMGARIIFHAVNGGRDGSQQSDLIWQYHQNNLQMRALAGKVWVVTVDNSCPVSLKCSAPSGVINPDGQWVCKAESRGVQYFVETIKLS